jgi:mannose-1-phosphate guanylyltransferase / mannose-6-phosphate isomerase
LGDKSENKIFEKPWGSFEVLLSSEKYKVKRLTINPGQKFSLQLHNRRSEHWVIVRGTARVTNGDNVSVLTENESAYIPIRSKHRLENPEKDKLEVIEVQVGDYLEEDDIFRFEDIYNRA